MAAMLDIEGILLPKAPTADDEELLRPLVTENCRRRVRDFRLLRDRLRTLCGEALVLQYLSERRQIDRRDIHWAQNQFGKPYIEGLADFAFNVAHDGEMVLAAFSGAAVGIDVALRSPIDIHMLSRLLSSADRRELEKFSGRARLEMFYALWTAKESYLKALGEGLSRDLDSFSLRFDLPRIQVCDPLLPGGKWHVHAWNIPVDYTISACFQGEQDVLKPRIVHFDRFAHSAMTSMPG